MSGASGNGFGSPAGATGTSAARDQLESRQASSPTPGMQHVGTPMVPSKAANFEQDGQRIGASGDVATLVWIARSMAEEAAPDLSAILA